jgi:type IV secretion system protein VirB9
MRKFLIFISIVCCFTSLAQASQMPRYLGTEKKFRSYIYNPNDVYRYIGHYTYQGFIEFEDGETIGTISMGSPTLWMFEHLGNRLFLKPVGEDNSETNMTVITNKRVYHFELMAKEAKSINDKDLIFVVKFAYPDEKDKNIVEFPRATPTDEPDLRDLSIYNFNYQYTGEPAIAPIKVFDNGEFTYFQFSKRNAEIPAIFTVDAAGFESLVNFRAAGSYIIVERVAPQFTLRNGTDIVCVYNTSVYVNGKPKDGGKSSIQNLSQSNSGTSPSMPQMPQMPPMSAAPNYSQPSQATMPPSGMPSAPSGYGAPSGPSGFPGMPPMQGGSGMPSGGMPPMPNGMSGGMMMPPASGSAPQQSGGMMTPPMEMLSVPVPGIGRIQ